MDSYEEEIAAAMVQRDMAHDLELRAAWQRVIDAAKEARTSKLDYKHWRNEFGYSVNGRSTGGDR